MTDSVQEAEVETLSPIAIYTRLNQVKCKDIADNQEFMIKYDANTLKVTQEIKTLVTDMQVTWKTDMEKLVAKPADAAWLNFLVIELGYYGHRITASFDRWISAERGRLIAILHSEDERTRHFYSKKFTRGIQTSQRLEAMIEERNGVKQRTFENYSKNQIRTQHGTLEEFRLTVPEVSRTFSRIFQRAIA